MTELANQEHTVLGFMEQYIKSSALVTLVNIFEILKTDVNIFEDLVKDPCYVDSGKYSAGLQDETMLFNIKCF